MGALSSNKLKAKNKFENIKSKYILLKIFDNLQKRRTLDIIKYNKNMQNRLNININNFQEYLDIYSPIEIEIIPVQKNFGNLDIKIAERLYKDQIRRFVNRREGYGYYHIFFDDDKEEIGRDYLKFNENINKIKIIINYQVKSFYELFADCDCIESIDFKKFYRNNITDMSYMFAKCESLQKINLNNFNTENVTYMVGMFIGCGQLNELNLKNFNINKVTNMVYMLYRCSEELKKKIKERYKDISEKAFDTY